MNDKKKMIGFAITDEQTKIRNKFWDDLKECKITLPKDYALAVAGEVAQAVTPVDIPTSISATCKAEIDYEKLKELVQMLDDERSAWYGNLLGFHKETKANLDWLLDIEHPAKEIIREHITNFGIGKRVHGVGDKDPFTCMFFEVRIDEDKYSCAWEQLHGLIMYADMNHFSDEERAKYLRIRMINAMVITLQHLWRGALPKELVTEKYTG